MTKAEWKAINDYCEENMMSRYEVMKSLKQSGTIARDDCLEDLDRYLRDHTYDAMMSFLLENV